MAHDNVNIIVTDEGSDILNEEVPYSSSPVVRKDERNDMERRRKISM
jgi:hypothetical protein